VSDSVGLRLTISNVFIQQQVAAKLSQSSSRVNVPHLLTARHCRSDNVTDNMLRALTQERLTEEFGFKIGEAVLFQREVRALHAAPSIMARVAISEIVPEVYFNLAKELHLTAMKFISKAAGASSTFTVTTVLTAVIAAASFSIRAACDAAASRMCCTVLKMLHTGGPPCSPQKDIEERKSWTHSFMLTCSLTIDKEFCSHDYYIAALNLALQSKQIIEDTLGRDNLVFATLLSNVAKYNGFLHRLEESEVIYKEAIHLIGDLMGKESIQVAASMVSLAGKQDIRENRVVSCLMHAL
jgi:hypothetical protein